MRYVVTFTNGSKLENVHVEAETPEGAVFKAREESGLSETVCPNATVTVEGSHVAR